MNTIDAKLLARMFLAGAKNLEVKKEWINELNVFPVPDGDTGTNMTLTIMSAVKEVNNLEDVQMTSLAKAISSGSLRGARGNSGVILSQLLRGFTKGIRDLEELDAVALARAVDKGVETAYKAVMKPKEGTILTVARGVADKALELAEDAENLQTFLEDVLEEGRRVLAKTPDMLPVLKEAGVVDSGGQGLMVVLEGAFDAFMGKEVDLTFDGGESAKVVKITPQAEADIKFGYCTEFIIVLNKEFTAEEQEKSEEIEKNTKALEERQKDLDQKKNELDEIIEETKQEEEKLRDKAKDLETKIEPRLLQSFKRIRKNSRNGLGIVYVQRDACGGCFNKIPPQRQLDIRSRKKIIVCEYCGRILIDKYICDYDGSMQKADLESAMEAQKKKGRRIKKSEE